MSSCLIYKAYKSMQKIYVNRLMQTNIIVILLMHIQNLSLLFSVTSQNRHLTVLEPQPFHTSTRKRGSIEPPGVTFPQPAAHRSLPPFNPLKEPKQLHCQYERSALSFYSRQGPLRATSKTVVDKALETTLSKQNFRRHLRVSTQ